MMKNILYWLPRILAILFIIFISSFALDVFEDSDWPKALFMHLIPSFILIILTIIAWKHEKTGGLLFLAAGLGMTIFFHSLIITIPILLIAGLFLVKANFLK